MCGHSLGAALTLRYCVARTDVVLGHVFTNSNSALADERWRAAIAPQVEAGARALEAGGRAAVENHPLHPARAGRVPAVVRWALAADARLHSPTGVAATQRHTVLRSPVRDLVHRHRAPALLVAGRRETSFQPAVDFARRAMPRLRVVEVDSGHAVNLQAVAAFNGAVTTFIRGIAGGR